MIQSYEEMATMLAQDDEAAIQALVAALVTSWNAGDGAGYGAHFTEDADFVNIYGRYINGRAAIIAGHQQIFDTIYRGSINSGSVEAVRALGQGLALARVAWKLRVPVGEAMEEMAARATIVLARTADGWRVVAFHNTGIIVPGGPRPGAAHS